MDERRTMTTVPAHEATTEGRAEAEPTAGSQTTLSTADIAASSRERPATPDGRQGASVTGDGTATAMGDEEGDAALFDASDADDLKVRWTSIQAAFVDEPRAAVEKADQLVAEVMQSLADTFAREHRDLERQWAGGSEASTEELRQAIRRYRSFFNRLLSL